MPTEICTPESECSNFRTGDKIHLKGNDGCVGTLDVISPVGIDCGKPRHIKLVCGLVIFGKNAMEFRPGILYHMKATSWRHTTTLYCESKKLSSHTVDDWVKNAVNSKLKHHKCRRMPSDQALHKVP